MGLQLWNVYVCSLLFWISVGMNLCQHWEANYIWIISLNLCVTFATRHLCWQNIKCKYRELAHVFFSIRHLVWLLIFTLIVLENLALVGIGFDWIWIRYNYSPIQSKFKNPNSNPIRIWKLHPFYLSYLYLIQIC